MTHPQNRVIIHIERKTEHRALGTRLKNMLRTRRYLEMNMRPMMASGHAMSVLVHPSMRMSNKRFKEKIRV